ncbi:MAG: hypothetical protein QOK43_3029 [Acidimicrobiaceae bacterium]|nr:hypothetical protein [Acidimicrobiaceae bacterium]
MADEATDATPRAQPRDLLVPLGLFAASRVVVWTSAWVAWFLNGKLSLGEILTKWDGDWYLKIVNHGYPTTIVRGEGNAAQSPLAFYPGYPALVRAVMAVTPFGPRTAAVLVNVVGAAAATVLLWLLARRLIGPDAATRAIALFAFFPGSYVLGMAYSEGLFLVAVGACFLLLSQRRWVLAGLACAVASATRPTGLVLVACCALAAFEAVRRRRELLAIAAPVIGSLGFAAFTVYLAVHAHDPLAWKYPEEHGWGQGLDFGRNTLRQAHRFLSHPLADLNVLVSMLTFGAVIALALLWWRSGWRAPAILVLYTVGILAPAVLSRQLYSTARFTMTAFPLFFAAGRVLKGPTLLAVLGAMAGGLALVTVLSGATYGLTP